MISAKSRDKTPRDLPPVSVWRTYFVANEWNEIQTARKISPVFQYFATLLFLSVIGVGNLATMDPQNNLHADVTMYTAPTSRILRFALIGIVYLLIGRYFSKLVIPHKEYQLATLQ